MNAVTSPKARLLIQRREVYSAERSAYLASVIRVVCAVILAVCFWYAVPYSFLLQLDTDPLKAAANEAAAYEGNLSRQIAMPVVLLVAATGLCRLPRVGFFSGLSRLASFALAYIAWAFASLAWSSDPDTDSLPRAPFSWLAVLGTAGSIPLAPYLPSLIAYSPIVSTCMSEDPKYVPRARPISMRSTRAGIVSAATPFACSREVLR